MRGDSHHEKRRDDGEVAEAVEKKAPALTDGGDQESGDCGTDEASAVGHGRVDGDGVAEVVGIVNHLHEKRLAAGHIEGVDEALKRGEGDDLPEIDAVSESERGHRKGLNGGGNLRPDEKFAAIEALDPYSGEGAEQDGDDLSGETDDAEQQSGMGEAVNEPTGGEARHPCADQRDALAEEVELEVAMAKGAPCVRKPGDSGGRRKRRSESADDSFFRHPSDDFAGADKSFAIGFVEFGDGFGDPGAFGVALADAKRVTLRSDVNGELAAIGRVRFAFDEGLLFQSRDGGAHRLWFHAFGASEVGGGGGAVDIEPFEDGGFGERKFMRSGCGTDAANEKADGLSEFDRGGFDGFSRHGKSVSERQVNLQVVLASLAAYRARRPVRLWRRGESLYSGRDAGTR